MAATHRIHLRRGAPTALRAFARHVLTDGTAEGGVHGLGRQGGGVADRLPSASPGDRHRLHHPGHHTIDGLRGRGIRIRHRPVLLYGRITVGPRSVLARDRCLDRVRRLDYGYRQGRTGSSVGKSVLKFKVVSENTGQPIGFGLPAIRQLMHIVDQVVCFIGYLNPLWDPKRQTLADKIMRTVCLPSA